jgi:hypothetical protein
MRSLRLSTSAIVLILAAGQPGCDGEADAPAASASGGTGGSATGTGGSVTGTGGSATGTGGSATGTGGSATGTGGSATDAGSDAMVNVSDAAAPDSGIPAGDTWQSFAQGFFASYCVGCHNDDGQGEAARDYHVLANVMKEKAEIACGVATPTEWTRRGCSGFPPAQKFPIGTGLKPDAATRDRLVRWIDANTP